MTGLSVRDLDVRLGGNSILRDVAFDLARGEVVGLIGPNGAGKSTLLKTLLGLVPIEAGEILLEGQSPQDLQPKERARLMAYAPQGAPVHWPLTVERLVELGRVPHLGPWQEPCEEDRAAVDGALEATDTSHLRQRIVTSLSGGERAGVMLARAIAVGAPYLLADEPVASLDPYHQIAVMEILSMLSAQGTGVVVVLHDLGLAMRYCQRLYLLNDGALMAEGAPAQVLTDDNLAQVYRVEAVHGAHGDAPYLVPWRRL